MLFATLREAVSTVLHGRDTNLANGQDLMLMQTQVQAQPNAGAMAAATIAAVGAITLCGAWFFQYVLGIQPCPMCLEQRYAYYLVIVLGALLALAASRLPRALVIALLGVLALAAFGNSIFGAFHAGVEWGFWQGPVTCSGPIQDLGSAGSLLQRLDTVKVVRCDEVQWRFLGLSLAGYNFLISGLMGMVALFGINKLRTA
jgi:disulfide bond formation protein DsbB